MKKILLILIILLQISVTQAMDQEETNNAINPFHAMDELIQQFEGENKIFHEKIPSELEIPDEDAYKDLSMSELLEWFYKSMDNMDNVASNLEDQQT